MTSTSGVSRRIQQCIERLHVNDHEGALVNLVPAIDKTAKKRRPKDGVGKRIKSFLKDEEVLITSVGMGNIFKDCKFGKYSLEEVLYKFGRTCISHEGELDHRLNFNSTGQIQIADENWNLPVGYVVAMTLAVIIAPENKGEKTIEGLNISLFERRFEINEVWGDPTSVREHICNKFGNNGLFN